MDRPFSDVNYDRYTTNAATVDVHVPAHPPLPALIEPDMLPPTPVPAAGDHEPLVPIEHQRTRILSPYWHERWDHALPGAYLRAGVADRLARVADSLPAGFGLGVFDAWRPLELQQEIYDAAYTDASLPAGFVSMPSTDPATPPPHLTGGTVDLTLTFDGVPLGLGTTFDAFVDDASTAAFESYPGPVRDLRRMLYWAMRNEQFVVIDCEWWHYEYGTRRWAALTGETPTYGAANL
jgi:zinc D-Ala-D-Ala dipeptidase